MKVSPGRSILTKYSSTSPRVGPKPRLPASRTFRTGASTMVPMFIRMGGGGAGVADVHPAFTVAEQLSPLLVGAQRVAAVLDEAQHVVEIRAGQGGIGGGGRTLRE